MIGLGSEIVEGSKSSFSEWLKDHKGARKGTGRTSDAMILAGAIRGLSNDELLKGHYQHKKGGSKKYGRTKIFSALSVNKEGDDERIMSLYRDFPDIFEGISEREVEEWFIDKRK